MLNQWGLEEIKRETYIRLAEETPSLGRDQGGKQGLRLRDPQISVGIATITKRLTHGNSFNYIVHLELENTGPFSRP